MEKASSVNTTTVIKIETTSPVNLTTVSPMKTLIVVILDESGSMQMQKNDVVGGYQSFIAEQKDITEDQARLILIKFNDKVTISHAAMSLETAPELTASNYQPRGLTALFDAVAEGIRIAEACVEKDDRVLVLIMTDGEENASNKSNSNEVRESMKQKEDLGNWTFTYIGQKPDVWAMSMKQSIGNVRAYNMQNQHSNMTMNSVAVSNFRKGSEKQSTNFYTKS